MDAWWMCEVPYPHVDEAVLESADSVRASLPNRYCDPRIAADLFEEVIDEYLLCDEMGLNVCATEHHAGMNSLVLRGPEGTRRAYAAYREARRQAGLPPAPADNFAYSAFVCVGDSEEE